MLAGIRGLDTPDFHFDICAEMMRVGAIEFLWGDVEGGYTVDTEDEVARAEVVLLHREICHMNMNQSNVSGGRNSNRRSR